MAASSVMDKAHQSMSTKIGALRNFVENETTDLQEPTGPVARASNAATVIAVVVIGIVALVGILIFGEVWNAMPMEEGDTLYTEADQIMTGFGDAMSLVPIILLVLLASIVIGVVQRMRGG